MRNVLALLFVVVVVAVGSARAADFYTGLKLQPGADAGTTASWSLADAGVSGGSQFMIRCDGFSVRYRICEPQTACVATIDDSAIDADQSVDVCGVSGLTSISVFRTYDGGVPPCRIYRVNPQGCKQ